MGIDLFCAGPTIVKCPTYLQTRLVLRDDVAYKEMKTVGIRVTADRVYQITF